MNGSMIVSLDYELFWGMQDITAIKQYKENISGTYEVIPKLLSLFDKYGIHSTWAVIGMMYAQNADVLKKFMPEERPSYINPKCSSYRCLNKIRRMHGTYDRYFFAPDMIAEIAGRKNTEIGSHTFSHYYCGEPGQISRQFERDLESDKKIRNGESVVSLVFPRNHSLPEYVAVLPGFGISAYRGLEDNWICRVRPLILMKFLRLADAYLPLTKTNEYFPKYENGTINIRGSRFFRPYDKKLFFLEGLKIKRIKGQMLHAAKNHLAFHLWWHPHNVGIHQEENLAQLEEIFCYYRYLHKKYGFQSMNMKEAAQYYKY